MRLWHFAPKYLDQKGLGAQWLEAIILRNELKKGKEHFMLRNILRAEQPLDLLNSYLYSIKQEADKRGYNFKEKYLEPTTPQDPVPITSGILQSEWRTYTVRVFFRDLHFYHRFLAGDINPKPNPVFRVRKFRRARRNRNLYIQ